MRIFRSLKHCVRIGFMLVAFLSLSGCSAILPVSVWYFLGGITVASVVVAKKLPTDIVADLDTGLDCDITRSIRDNTEYCQLPDYLQEKSNVRNFCYRSLGSITCYKEPNPFLDNTAEVGTVYTPDTRNKVYTGTSFGQ